MLFYPYIFLKNTNNITNCSKLWKGTKNETKTVIKAIKAKQKQTGN